MGGSHNKKELIGLFFILSLTFGSSSSCSLMFPAVKCIVFFEAVSVSSVVA